MVYDYKSDVTGIGNRSLTDIDESLTEYTQLYCCYLMGIEALCLHPYSVLLGFKIQDGMPFRYQLTQVFVG